MPNHLDASSPLPSPSSNKMGFIEHCHERWQALVLLLDTPFRYLFGRDIFFSYSRGDAYEYTRNLASAVEKRLLENASAVGNEDKGRKKTQRVSFYLDQYSSIPGKDLPRPLKRHLRRSNLLVLVGTPRAVRSDYVQKEVETFVSMRRPVVPINFKDFNQRQQDKGTLGAFEQMDPWAIVIKTGMESEDLNTLHAQALSSEAVVTRVEKALGFTLQEQRLNRAVWGTVVTIGLLLATFGIVTFYFVKTAQAARQERAAVQKELVVAQQEIKQAQAETNRLKAETESLNRVAQQAKNKAEQAKAEAEQQTAIAKQKGKEARQNLYVANMNVAQRAYEADNDAQVLEALGEYLPSTNTKNGESDLRGFEWYYLWEQQHKARHKLFHGGEHASVAFSPDGQLLAGNGWGTIKLLDVTTGKVVAIGNGATYVDSAAFAPDGKTLATGNKEHTIELWDVASCKELKTCKEPRKLKGHDFGVTSVAFAPDGKMLASGSQDGTIRLWDVDRGKELIKRDHADKQSPSRIVRSVAFATDGKTLTLASSGDDGTIKLWDVSTSDEGITNLTERIKPIENKQSVTSVVFAPDGKTLASGDMDNNVRFWNVTTGEPRNFRDVTTGQYLNTLKGHAQTVWSLAFTPDGKTLASGSDDDTIRLWDVVTGKEIRTLKHENHVFSVAFTRDGKTLASGGEGGSIKLWDVKELSTLQHSNSVYRLTFTPDGKLTSGDKNTFRFWDVTTGKEQSPPLKLEEQMNSLAPTPALTPDGKTRASADGNTIKLWDVARGKLLGAYKADSQAVWSVVFSQNGRMLASSGQDHTIVFWAITPGRDGLKLTRGVTLRKQIVSSMAFTQDGRTFASSSFDSILQLSTIQLWDVATGKLLGKPFQGHAGRVSSLAFAPDGKTLASGDETSAIKLWDITTGRELATLKGRASVMSLAFALDSRTLASGEPDGTVRLWFAATDEQVKEQRRKPKDWIMDTSQ
jgi:WD40 repeat protein